MTALPMDKRQRPSAARMLAFLLLVLVIAAQLVGALVLKQDHWGEDGMVIDTRTAAWSAGRQDGSEVENGLAILNKFEPHQVSYLRSRGNPIEFIPCTKGRRGYTSIPEGVVHVCEQYRHHSAEVAVVLSHESSTWKGMVPISGKRTFPLSPLLRLYRGAGSTLAER